MSHGWHLAITETKTGHEELILVYRKLSNIRRTKSPNLNDLRLLL